MRWPISASPGHRSTNASPGTTVPAPDLVAGFRAKVSRPALDVLPPGTLTVGAGLLVLGAGYYAHFAVAGHSLPASGMADLSVLWSIVFLPVEQELIRHVAERKAVGEGAAPVVRRACGLSGLVLAVILVPLAAAAR